MKNIKLKIISIKKFLAIKKMKTIILNKFQFIRR